jgi:hypothetical protein
MYQSSDPVLGESGCSAVGQEVIVTEAIENGAPGLYREAFSEKPEIVGPGCKTMSNPLPNVFQPLAATHREDGAARRCVDCSVSPANSDQEQWGVSLWPRR